MTAALHEVKIVCVGAASGEAPQHTVGGIVDKKHNMRHFKRRAAPHAYTRRYALRHRALGRAYERRRIGGKIVFLKIDSRHKTAAEPAVALRALEPHRTAAVHFKDTAVYVVTHCGMYRGYARVRLAEVDLRQHESER